MADFRAVLSVCALVTTLANIAFADVFGTGVNQFTIGFVPISAATNPTSGKGKVANAYQMGTCEITNSQWNKFRSSLGVPVTGSPSSAYDMSSQFTGANVPVNNVSWYEAAQFVNWLNTSTGHQAAYKFTGTQGASDYTLAVWSPAEADNGTNLYRHKDAFYYLPTENEWIKAACWNGTRLQTYSNASPDDLLAGSRPDQAKWNYYPSAGDEPWNVGSGVQELNGTYDMMGNVWEWMESPYYTGDYGDSWRTVRGGSYEDNTWSYLASYWEGSYSGPSAESSRRGFRVASEVPEPSCVLLLLGGGMMLLKSRRTWRQVFQSDRGPLLIADV
jgi:formylglycine-generating enzyme required for sulfatase activity